MQDRMITVSLGTLLASIGFFLYVVLIWSYTVATFTSPGTPLGSVCYLRLIGTK